jgi:hypothetical protein
MQLHITSIGTPQPKGIKGSLGNFITVSEPQYAGKRLSFFCNPETDRWQIGQTVDVDVTIKPGINSKTGAPVTWYNLSLPKKAAYMPQNAPIGDELARLVKQAIYQEIAPIKLQLQKIIDHLSKKDRLDRTSAGTPMPTFVSKEIEEDWNISDGMEDDFNNSVDNPRS